MPPAKKSQKAPVPERIIDAMLSVAAEKGWVKLGLHDIAAEAGISLVAISSEPLDTRQRATRVVLLRSELRRA